MIVDKLLNIKSVLQTAEQPVVLYLWGVPSNRGAYPPGVSFYTSPTSTGTSWKQLWGTNPNAVTDINGYGYIQGFHGLTHTAPVAVSWTQIVAGVSTGIGIDSGNRLYGWGVGILLGGLSLAATTSPVQITTMSWTSISTGHAAGIPTAHAIRSDGALFAWGVNTYGQLGLNDVGIHRSSPVQIGTSSWLQVDTGGMTTTAIRADNTLWGWGLNTYGQLGIIMPVESFSWTQIATGGIRVTAILTGGTPTSAPAVVAIRSDGTLWAWGNNTFGQLGLNNVQTQLSPVQVGMSSWSFVSVGARGTTLAIRSDGTLWGWGRNDQFQLGLGQSGNNTHRSSPVQIGIDADWRMVLAAHGHAGHDASLALKTNGTMYGWGNGTRGLTALNTTATTLSPTQIGTSSWTTIASGNGADHALAIRADGALFAWGRNNLGQIGETATPTGKWSVIAQASAFSSHVGAIRSDGALFMWGNGTSGSLALNDQGIHRSSPVQVGTSSWTSISTGGSGETYAIRSDGALFVWGRNNAGQLGLNDAIDRSSPVQVGASSWAVVDVSAAGNAFAIRTDGALFAWGVNTNGVLGLNDIVHRSSPVQIGSSSWSAISADGDGTNITTAAIRSDGALFIWGVNQAGGTFGDNTTAGSRSSPIQLGTDSWSIVDCGYQLMSAIRNDGTLWGWGLGHPRLGPVNDNRSSPVIVAPGSWTKVTSSRNAAAQGGRVYAVRSDSTLWGGYVSTAAAVTIPLGDGILTPTTYRSWRQIGSLIGWTDVRSTGGGAYALRDQELWLWGLNTAGQLGQRDVIHRSSPVQLGAPAILTSIIRSSPVQIGTESWTAIATGANHSLAIRKDGIVFAWGANGYVEPSEGQYSWRSVVASGYSGGYSYAIRDDYTLWSWGNGSNGLLGVNTGFGIAISPTQIGGDSWVSVHSSTEHTVAIRSDGALFTWGTGTNGRLGLGDVSNRQSPVQVGTSSWTTAVASVSWTVAIRADSTLWAWGGNNSGQLGQGNTIDRSSPVQIGTSSWTSLGIPHGAWIQGSFGDSLWGNPPVFAIRADSTLWVWGGNIINRGTGIAGVSLSSPVQVGTSSWTAVTSSAGHSLAIRTDGTLWAWGDNFFGQLGQNDTIHRSTPVQIPGTGSWTAVRCARDTAAAIRSDGTLWTWGRSVNLTHGHFLIQHRSSPTLVYSTNTKWSSFSIGSMHGAAISQNGLLWMWGANENGQLGDGTTNNTTIPQPLIGYSRFTAVGQSSPVMITLVQRSWANVFATPYGGALIGTNGALWAWGVATGRYENKQSFNENNPPRSIPVQVDTGSWTLVSSATTDEPGSGFTTFINNIGQAYIATGSEGNTSTNSPAAMLAGGGRENQMPMVHGLEPHGRLIGTISPIQISSSSWSSIATGTSTVAAIRSDGALFTWGAIRNTPFTGSVSIFERQNDGDYDGILGLNSTTSTQSPVQVGTSSWVSVSIFDRHAAAIRSDGALFTWGTSGGRLGDNTIFSRSSPVQIGTSSWIRASAGSDHTAAIRSDNQLFTWGNNTFGQLGITAGPAYSWSTISSNNSYAMAIRSDGTLWGWGAGTDGGNAIVNPRTNSTEYYSWTKIASSGSHTLALRNDGTVWMWGRGDQAQIAVGDLTHRSSPIQLGTTGSGTAPSTGWVDIAVGSATSHALRNDGSLWGWGTAFDGQGGWGNTLNQNPTKIGASSWLAIGSGSAIRADGALFTWGHNGHGQLGDGTTAHRSSPVQIGSSSWIALASVFNSSISSQTRAAIRSDGALFTWGRNDSGQLGQTDRVHRSSPIQVGTSSWSMMALDYGGFTSAAIRSDGALFTWGFGSNGTLGQNDNIHRSSPVQVGTSSWLSVGGGGGQLIGAIRSDGALFTWGFGGGGRLGLGDQIHRSSPVQVGTSSWAFVNSASEFCYAISSTGGIWEWGVDWIYGVYGMLETNNHRSSPVQLGFFTTTHRSSPTQIGTSSWSAISAGHDHALAIRSDGALFTWGFNSGGQLGNDRTGSPSSIYSPVQIGTSSWVAVAAQPINQQQRSYAIRSDGALFAWGRNDNGNLGDGTIAHRSSPVQIGTSSWTAVSSGNDYAVALRTDGALFAWGYNILGSLGLGDQINRSSPVQIGTSSWIAVAANLYAPLAIRSDGALFTWGLNSNGQLAQNNLVHRSSPVQIGTSSWIALGRSRTNTNYAIRKDYTLWGWGNNDANGALMDPSGVAGRSSPIQLAFTNFFNWSNIEAGVSTFHAIRADGALFAWGRNEIVTGYTGLLGTNDGAAGVVARSSPVQVGSNGVMDHRSSPVQVKTQVDVESWTQVSAGVQFTLGLRSNNTLWGWGINTGGQLAISDSLNRSNPIQIGGNVTPYYTSSENPILISSSPYSVIGVGAGLTSYTTAIRSDGTLWTWGINDVGQLGLGDVFVNRSSPVQIGLSAWSTLTSIPGMTLAIRSDGRMFGWGRNSSGELGEQIGETYSWISMAAGFVHVVAVRSDGSLWAWGQAGNGGLGTNDAIDRSSPVQVGTSSWISVDAGSRWTMALRADNTLWMWGNNENGQLGQNDLIHRSSPVQVGTSSWIQIAGAGLATAAAIRLDGGVFVWGKNTYGQLGQSDRIHRSSPTQVGTSSWAQVGVGRSTDGEPLNVFAIRSDGALFGWGENFTGQLAQNNRTDSSSPVQIGTSSWTAVSPGNRAVLAIRSDGALFAWGGGAGLGLEWGDMLGEVSGTLQQWSAAVATSGSAPATLAIRSDRTLWAWGYNLVGALGTNDTVHRSSPVQVGTSSWTSVASNSSGQGGVSFAIRSDGGLFGWGSNASGQLGLNDRTHRSSPVQVGTSSWTMVVARPLTTTAIRSDGGLFIWGEQGVYGLFGTNATALTDATPRRSSPVQLGADSWVAVGGTSDNILAIRSDNTLWTWGDCTTGSLGLNDRTHRSSPVQIGVDTDWQKISIGGNFAIKTNGTLWAWGENTHGQLGANDTIHRSSPVQIPGSWTVVDRGVIGYNQNVVATLGIRTDGTLWAWGFNSQGNLGTIDTVHRSSPVQIPGSWTSLSVGYSHMTAIDTSGYLYTWGSDVAFSSRGGALGDSTFTNDFTTSAFRSSPVMVRPHVLVGVHRSSPVQLGTSSWTQVSAGQALALALRSDGIMFAWGRGGGNLPIDGIATRNRSSPTQVGNPPSSWSLLGKIGSSAGHMALKTDGTLWVWGSNGQGQHGNLTAATAAVTSPMIIGAFNPRIHRSSPVQVGVSTMSWLTVSAGGPTEPSRWAAAIRSDGTLWGWGSNFAGQLGQNDIISRSSPVQISSSSWTAVAVGGSHLVARRVDGTLWAAGGNASGQLGELFGTTHSWTTVRSGVNLTFAIRSDGMLFGWGDRGGHGQLGQWTTASSQSPIQIGNSSWTAVDTSGEHVLAIRADGALFAWGRNNVGQLGQNDIIHRSSPAQVGTGSWTTVVAGISVSAAINTTGELWMWGENGIGQLGQLDFVHRSSPVLISAGAGLSWTLVATPRVSDSNNNARQVVAAKTNNTIWSWGDNYSLALGLDQDPQPRRFSSPVQLAGLPTSFSWTQIVTSAARTMMINTNNEMWGVGYNIGIRPGSGTTAVQSFNDRTVDYINIFQSSSPTVQSWQMVATGYEWTAAVRSDGGLFAWGFNGNYQLGTGNFINRSSPVQIGTSSWTAVAAGYNHGAAIRADGALFMWGANTWGQLGQNDGVSRSSPVQIGTSSWIYVGAMMNSTFAIRADGALFAWGRNEWGNLGLGDRNHRSSPVQVGTSSWTLVEASTGQSAFGESTFAIRSDGALFGWGDNLTGQLGQNDTVHRSSPIQIGSNSWKMVASCCSGNEVAVGAIRSDDTLWMWGGSQSTNDSNSSSLGFNDTVHRSSPVQLSVAGVSSWRTISLSTETLTNRGAGVLAISGDYSIYFWGQGYSGKEVSGNQVSRRSPVFRGNPGTGNLGFNFYDGSTSRRVEALAKGPGYHMAAITNDGLLWTWGGPDQYGHKGHGDEYFYFFDSSTRLVGRPQHAFRRPILMRSNVTQVGTQDVTPGDSTNTSGDCVFVRRTDGIIEAIGYNTFGTLGLDDIANRSSWTQVGTSSWTFISGGGRAFGHSTTVMGILSNGILYAWGPGNSSGLSDVNHRSSPVAVGARWNLSLSRSSLVQIGTDRSWVNVAAAGGGTTTWAIDSNYRLWGWGTNTTFQLGTGPFYTATSQPFPTQISSSASWTQIRPNYTGTQVGATLKP